METCSTQECNDSSNEPVLKAQAPSPVVSTAPNEDRAQLKGLLAEARQTREMLTDFDTAVKNGSYQGHQMLAIAKGLAFLIAILHQNKAHIDNLQQRLS